MDTINPVAVMQYLQTLNINEPVFAFIGIDKQNIIQFSGGSIEQFGLGHVSEGTLALEKLVYLEGLLQGDNKPVVIENTQFMNERFVDLHLFNDRGLQWVVFIDNTEAGKARQTEQQEQLNIDILEEARKR